MKHALKILGLGFLLVPAAFSQTVGSSCNCQIDCNGTLYQYANTTVAFCCKQANELCGEEAIASCTFSTGTVRTCWL